MEAGVCGVKAGASSHKLACAPERRGGSLKATSGGVCGEGGILSFSDGKMLEAAHTGIPSPSLGTCSFAAFSFHFYFDFC